MTTDLSTDHSRAVADGAHGHGVGAAPEASRAARLTYLTPSHQYPTGATLSLARRLELLEKAQSDGGWIINQIDLTTAGNPARPCDPSSQDISPGQ